MALLPEDDADPFEVQDREIASIELAGRRHRDGQIELMGTARRRIPDWPRTVALKGAVYTLERVVTGAADRQGTIFENAVYV